MLKIQLLKGDPVFTDDTIVLQSNGANQNLLVTPSNDGTTPIFYYSFFGSIFMIENATRVEFLPTLDEYDGFTRQIVIIISNNILYIIPFQSYHNRKDILRNYPATYKILGHVAAKYLYSFASNQTRFDYLSKLRLMRKNGFYYINWNPCENLENNQPAMVVRFNCREVSKYVVPSGAKAIFDDTSCCTPIKYLVSDKEIFDVDAFKSYDISVLLSRYSLEYQNLFFRIFSIYQKKVLFVSKNLIDFKALRNNSSVLISTSTYTEGFLYDLSSNQLVIDENADGIWHKFFLYDDGIPHIVKKTVPGGAVEFNVFRYHKNSQSFDSVLSAEKPIIVSYASDRTSTDGEKTSARFIFLTQNDENIYNKSEYSPSDDKYLMMVLDENLETICFDDCIELEAVNFCSQNSTCTVSKQHNTTVFHLAGNDSIILKSCKGDYGDRILMYLNEPIKVNYCLSFFGYQRIVLGIGSNNGSSTTYPNSKFLLVNTRKNDFENINYVINLQSHKIYSYEEFLKLLGGTN